MRGLNPPLCSGTPALYSATKVLPLAMLVLALYGCGGDDTGGEMASIPPELIEQVIVPFNRGVGLMDQYRPVEAVAAFEEVVQLAPDWVTGRLNYGIALLNAQTDDAYAQAEVELGHVIEMDPDDPYAHYALGMLLVYYNRPDEARAQFEEVLRIDPQDGDAHFQLATLVIDDDPEGARGHLEATLDVVPHHESATYRLATLLRRLGEPEVATEMLLRFQALKASGAGAFWGMKYGEMGRYAEIVRAFEGPVGGDGPSLIPAFAEVSGAFGLGAVAPGSAGWPGVEEPLGVASFGPGVAVADIEGQGTLSVYFPGVGPDGRGVLYRAVGSRFETVAGTGIDGRGAIAAYFGDYDGDGDPDLFLTRAGPDRLYRNEGGGRFTDVTAESGIGGGDFVSVGAAWADADHDGDLDLYVASFGPVGDASVGGPNALWRNNGNGSFTEMAAEAGIDGGDVRSTGVLYFDFDEDRDLDLYVVNHEAPNRLYLNDRVGQYTDATELFPELADDGPGLGALVGDWDRNGREDLLLLRGAEAPRLYLHLQRGTFVEDDYFAAMAREIGGATSAVTGDFDLDGDLDLVLLGAGRDGSIGHRILMNGGGGRFEAPTSFGSDRASPDARGAVAVDFDGDGGLELLVARVGAGPELWRAPVPEGRHWLTVLPTSAESEDRYWVDPTADGLLMEIKAGRRIQVASVSSSSGFLGSPPLRAHFGLGEDTKVDYVRLSWTDAVIQSELEVAADQDWRITKIHRKPSSCPVLFAWNGERFEFITDFLGVGGLGFFMAPGEYAPPDATEDVRIPPDLIAPRDGRYLLRVAEPLEEVTYLDQLHLVAYDHPSEWEVYPDERFTGSEPFATGEPFVVAEKIFPEAASTHRGEDMLERILTIDRQYVDPPRLPGLVGYSGDHWLELDFGDRLRDFGPEAQLVLYLHGWVEYTYSHVNYAAYQAGMSMTSPWIEVPDGEGGWRVAMPEAGFPAGLPRMMTLDISELPVRSDGRFRIRTNMDVSWDQVFIGENVRGPELRRHVMEPVVAELRVLGYPREYSPDGSDPTVYDYQRLDQGVPFKNLTGAFTRLGDVRELLRDVDDRFVVMARGEEVALEFDATQLPELPPGWSRTLVLHSDGFCKDMDLYTAFPETVEPFPFHGMENYPPLESMPDPAGFQEYMDTWNTRRVVGR